MKRFIIVVALMFGFGAIKLPMEHRLSSLQQQLRLNSVRFDLGLREQLGQLGFIAALSGFRAIIADLAFIRAHVAWEQTEWGRVLLLFREATALQPHAILFWDMAAWHMGWNASAAVAQDANESRPAFRLKTQREYYSVARDFLERGIRNNPDQPRLYESLARLYKEKYNDHASASEFFGKAAALPGAPSYDKRFAAYELSYCEGREQEAYRMLRRLYDLGEQERLPTLISRLKAMEDKLNVPPDRRIPDR